MLQFSKQAKLFGTTHYLNSVIAQKMWTKVYWNFGFILSLCMMNCLLHYDKRRKRKNL